MSRNEEEIRNELGDVKMQIFNKNRDIDLAPQHELECLRALLRLRAMELALVEELDALVIDEMSKKMKILEANLQGKIPSVNLSRAKFMPVLLIILSLFS